MIRLGVGRAGVPELALGPRPQEGAPLAGDGRREPQAVHPEVEDGPGALQPQPFGHLACVDQLLPVGVERHRLVCSPWFPLSWARRH